MFPLLLLFLFINMHARDDINNTAATFWICVCVCRVLGAGGDIGHIV